MSIPNAKNDDPTLLKIATKDVEIKEVEYETEKHDHGNFLKSLKIEYHHYRKNYKT